MRLVLLVLAVFGVIGLSGCSGSGEAEPSVDEALAFTGLVVPQGSEVVAFDAEHGIDSRYRLAVAVNADAVDRLLADSQFSAPLEQGRAAIQAPLPQVSIGTDIASATDELPPGPGRPTEAHRELLLDRSNPARPVIHVWAFTT
ncbi:hypothetical protein [Saccharopolyspora sp. NPDC002686]|uniref:hypothetical protein n=1 Tax=Saccharopolyspora sp. NPDC002686 TaxID=3154541 RepID=UPI003317F678